MKRILYITIFITVILFSILGITYSYEYNDNESLSFKLIGPSILYIDINNKYEEYGIKVMNNGVDISSSVMIDSSLVNTSLLGEYKVKYELNVDGNKEYVYRIVKVIDKEVPEIKLKGEYTVDIILNGSYYEEGYEVNDNYDTDLNDKVEIISNLDISSVGEYKIEYRVVDSNGNVGNAVRIVNVIEPKITLADISGNKYVSIYYDANRYTNTITKNEWIDNGVYFEGYVKDDSSKYVIKLKNKDNALEYLYGMNMVKKNYYDGEIDLSKMPNGEYFVYIVGNKEEKLLNKLDGLSRLLRAKIGDKLVTFSYDEDIVNIIIDDFKYEYDILIDPGHGGMDIGASNGIIYEKEINLEQSMYEKCRYESMGYKVFMTRYDDTYGTMMGTSQLDELQRRALTIGYFGTVSKVSYSNHHNASLYSQDYGFEIIVSNELNNDDLVLEKSLYNKYKSYYSIDDDILRLYSRDYDTGNSYNKLGGRVYSYMDYYAVIRIPNELFNVKTVIYEPIYMSNSKDFNWYYTNKNWIDVTEIKIEEYVNYLGGKYNSDNSMCL